MLNARRILTKVSLGLLLLIAASCIAEGKAQAATLTVGADCSLSEAIQSVNSGANAVNCVAAGAAYGTNDTITIPAGSVTLNANLLGINKSVVINGAGTEATTINANNFVGFTTSLSDTNDGEPEPLTQSVTISNLKITGALQNGIYINAAANVVISDVIVDDCDGGLNLSGNLTSTVRDSIIENNVVSNDGSTEIFAGLLIDSGTLDPVVEPEMTVETSIIRNNSAASFRGSAGLVTGGTATQDGIIKITVRGTTVMNNTGGRYAGLFASTGQGPLSVTAFEMLIDATTIANNTVVSPIEFVSNNPVEQPVVSGVFVSGRLTDQYTFTNVTVANNTASVVGNDNRNVIAGFWGIFSIDSSNVQLVNTTVVGNSVTQAFDTTLRSSFFMLKVAFDLENFSVIDVQPNATAQNVLLANNTRNGEKGNCLNNMDLSRVGATGTADGTPTSLGGNMSDDQSCTGYTYVPNLYDTIEHEVADNGGPVPTIALHDDSPAVNGGAQVLGITTDARGVARTGYYSVGAYQGNLLATTTTNQTVTTAGQLAKTGLFVALATPLGMFLVATPMYLLWDYRRHKQPLMAADPNVNYTFWHHVKVVSVPIVKYRLSLTVDRSLIGKSNRVNRF